MIYSQDQFVQALTDRLMQQMLVELKKLREKKLYIF
jgi:hypothetical protein